MSPFSPVILSSIFSKYSSLVMLATQQFPTQNAEFNEKMNEKPWAFGRNESSKPLNRTSLLAFRVEFPMFFFPYWSTKSWRRKKQLGPTFASFCMVWSVKKYKLRDFGGFGDFCDRKPLFDNLAADRRHQTDEPSWLHGQIQNRRQEFPLISLMLEIG